MKWPRLFRRRPPQLGPPEPRRCRDRPCELIAGHPPPHYQLTTIESGWGGWRRCGWTTWNWGDNAAEDYPRGWLRTWPGTMTATLEAKR